MGKAGIGKSGNQVVGISTVRCLVEISGSREFMIGDAYGINC